MDNKLLLVLFCVVTLSTCNADTSQVRFMDPVGYLHHHKGPINDGHRFVSNPTVHIEGLGTAKGTTVVTFLGRYVSAFRGIPYAHKPERFQYANIYNNTAWTNHGSGMFDATMYGPNCPQHSLVLPIATGNEDCLSINIYTPYMSLNSTSIEPLPVMVFIHGGAYITGEASLYNPSKLMDHDVVVAVIQYRLGTFGFLYSGTPDAPGNMGLMDQITALRWVKQYISYFGGNKDLVTVFGQSAGGASTSWMQITPLTGGDYNDGEDLANQFIAMSGSALEYWTLEHNKQDGFTTQVNATGCLTGNENNVTAMVDCMKQLDFSDVVLAAGQVYINDRHAGGLGFIGQVPVVQNELIGVLPDDKLVIVEDPMVSLRNGRFRQVPLMTGSTRDEGSLVAGLLYKDFISYNGYEDDEAFLRDDLLPMFAEAFGIYDNTHSVSNSLRLAYFPREAHMGLWGDMSGPLVDMGGTMFLKSGLWTVAHEMTVASDITKAYFYSFEFESDDSLFDFIFFGYDMPIEGGITHADDLLYLFGMPSLPDDRETEMIRRMTLLYTNFAKYGDPTPDEVKDNTGQWEEFTTKWLPYSPDQKNFMLLQDNFTVEEDFVLRWNYNKYGYPDKPTTTEVPTTAGIKEPNWDEGSQSSNQSDEDTVALIIGIICACVVLVVAITAFLTYKHKNNRKATAVLTLNGRDNYCLHSMG